MASLFDHLVGAGEQRRRHVEMRTEPICFSLYLYRARNLVEVLQQDQAVPPDRNAIRQTGGELPGFRSAYVDQAMAAR